MGIDRAPTGRHNKRAICHLAALQKFKQVKVVEGHSNSIVCSRSKVGFLLFCSAAEFERKHNKSHGALKAFIKREKDSCFKTASSTNERPSLGLLPRKIFLTRSRKMEVAAEMVSELVQPYIVSHFFAHGWQAARENDISTTPWAGPFDNPIWLDLRTWRWNKAKIHL